MDGLIAKRVYQNLSDMDQHGTKDVALQEIGIDLNKLVQSTEIDFLIENNMTDFLRVHSEYKVENFVRMFSYAFIKDKTYICQILYNDFVVKGSTNEVPLDTNSPESSLMVEVVKYINKNCLSPQEYMMEQLFKLFDQLGWCASSHDASQLYDLAIAIKNMYLLTEIYLRHPDQSQVDRYCKDMKFRDKRVVEKMIQGRQMHSGKIIGCTACLFLLVFVTFVVLTFFRNDSSVVHIVWTVFGWSSFVFFLVAMMTCMCLDYRCYQ